MKKQGRKGEREKGRFFVLLFLACFIFFVGKSTAQNLENLSEQIRFGTIEIKRSALAEIRNLENETASRLAIPALADANEVVRATAVFSVIFLPKDEAFSVLTPLLQDKSELVRRETAYALGKIQNSAAVNILIQTFQRDKILEVKNACIVALGEIGDVSAVDFLNGILRTKPKEKDSFLRRSAARSIGQIAQIIQIQKSQVVTPTDFLPEKYKQIIVPKYTKLSVEFAYFKQSVPILINILKLDKEIQDVKREAAFALGAIGDNAAVDVLQANLNNQDYYLSEICKESLRKLQFFPAKDTK